MRPQRQLIDHDPGAGQWGDCQRTCVAAILDMDAAEVPHFCDDANPNWLRDMREWLADRGLAYAQVAYSGSDATLDQVLDWTSRQSIGVPMIVAGSSAKGSNHVVVFLDGEIVCDPSGTGLIGPTNENTWEVGTISVAHNWAGGINATSPYQAAFRHYEHLAGGIPA